MGQVEPPAVVTPPGLYLAGEYCEGFYFTVPTMERASESAKLAIVALHALTGIPRKVQGASLEGTVLFIPQPGALQKAVFAARLAMRTHSPLWSFLVVLIVVLLAAACVRVLARGPR